jgi:hypothetical protein
MSKLKARRMARHEQAEVFDKLKPGARRMAGRRSDYSTTMIESRSGAVSPEIEEIVIVFEPARSSKFTLATPAANSMAATNPNARRKKRCRETTGQRNIDKSF